MLNNKCINKDAYIEKALIDYRLSALLTYRLVTAIQEGLDHNEIIAYYKNMNLTSIKYHGITDSGV